MRQYPGLSKQITTMYENVYREAVRMHSGAFRSTPEGTAIARRRDGGYLCCGYCGTGWEEEAGCCVACGAPAGAALKDYLDTLKDSYDDRPYMAVGAPILCSTNWADDYNNYTICDTGSQ